MKANIHPDYLETIYQCACGHKLSTRSVTGGTVKIEICSACHPFYTGKQKIVDTQRRVSKFEQRYKRS